ncbi:Hypothetical predicted protein [Olea europaea subsp. europaea]|uniref:Uncharacterized protein n=1 Tax=Olea europaea subsp. europaea TaxID=158383 RepID=A0A8S0S4C7_OLEEU|nr:Hypothetical predicted protein [Olea europaea subsp. europaea]
MDGQHEDSEEDPDFVDSDNDLGFEEDDVEYNRKGKMVPERASKDHNHGSERTFHFIPTPRVSSEAQMSGLKSGPLETICTPSVFVDVPTNYVNLDNVIDDLVYMENAESASRRLSRAKKRQCMKQMASAGPSIRKQ